MSADQDVDILISAKWIIPVIPEDQVFSDCSIAIAANKIVGIYPQSEALKRFNATEIIDLNEHALIPGLINAHGHLAMSLLRGYADDLPLYTWLEQHIWPAEGRWVSPEFVKDGAQLAMAEMIRGGTTCFSDMYFFPDQVAEAAQQANMRAQITAPVLDFPTAWADNADEYISKAIEVHDQFRTSSLITVGFGPHAPYTVSDAPFQKVATYAEELQAPIQVHLHETAQEVSDALSNTGKRPIERLNELGFFSPAVQCVHMTTLTDEDIEVIQRCGAHVIHCPESNLKLASGMAPVAKLLKAGVNVALGTDGCASNNDLDLLGEMRTAALLAKAVSGDAAMVNAHQALRMATINGAKAMGKEREIGSLEVGKFADIAAIKLDQIENLPMFNPVSQLVYSHVSHQVSDVWVNGQPVMRQRELLTLNQRDIANRIQQWQQKMSAK
ncbi:TRZ/ATZ family hydrolase [Aurantivibrio plasticivorans]